MRAKPDPDVKAPSTATTWPEMMAEARAKIGVYQPPRAAAAERVGRPLTDPYPGRPVELYLRHDVERWLKTKAAELKLQGIKVNISQIVNDLVRGKMREEQALPEGAYEDGFEAGKIAAVLEG